MQAIRAASARLSPSSAPNEMPAIWCLFSIAIIAIGLIPWPWRRLEVRAPAEA
jgi:hypothetical protein